MTGTALILGASGRFGGHMADALWNGGWKIRRFDRDRDDLLQAAQGVDVIINGWNPTYNRWAAEIPGQTEAVIAAARASGARIVLGGNVYVFGEGSVPEFGPDAAHGALNPLGRIRAEMEAQYRASGLPLLILRSGDYLDTEPSGNWFDRIIAKDLHKGRIAYPGDLDTPHAWAFLPDVAAIGLGLLRRELPVQLEVPTPGFTLTGREMAVALGEVLGREVAVRRMPWWPLYLAQVAVPFVRGMIEMRYLWSKPHWLDAAPLETWLPEFKATPLHMALAQCSVVKDLVASADQPRQGRGGLPALQAFPARAR